MALPAASPRLAHPMLAIPLTAAAAVLLALLGWSALAGGPCGSTSSKAGAYLVAWALPIVGSLAFALYALKARPLIAALGAAAGLAATFGAFVGIVFPLCG